MTEREVGSRIAALRKEKNMTQSELADALGVSDKTVSKWETGGGYPDITMLSQISDRFDVSIDFILRGKPKTKQILKYAFSPYQVDAINDNYLDKGWKIADLKLSGDGEGGFCAIALMEKDIFEDQT